MGVFSGSLLILSIVSLTIRWMQAPTERLLIPIGLLWVVLTVGFEIGFGRLAAGYSWDRLASDYDLPEVDCSLGRLLLKKIWGAPVSVFSK
jgi:hypothetical protein